MERRRNLKACGERRDLNNYKLLDEPRDKRVSNLYLDRSRLITYWLGFFAFIIVFGIPLYGYYVMVVTALIPYLSQEHSLLFWIDFTLEFIIGHAALIYYFWSYLMCVFVYPGDAPDNYPDGKHDMRDLHVMHKAISKGMLICKRCKIIKPHRTHHCSICKRCIMRMDHHCPWINNCVGYRNHKFFVQFLFSVPLISLCAGWTCIRHLLHINWGALEGMDPWDIQIILVIMFAVAFGIGIGLFACFHLYQVLINQTTMESFTKFRAAANTPEVTKLSRWDVGVEKNVRQLFGETVWQWVLPIQHTMVEQEYPIPNPHLIALLSEGLLE